MKHCTVIITAAPWVAEEPEPPRHRVVCSTCWVVMHEDTAHPWFHAEQHLTGKDPGIPLKIAIRRRKKSGKVEVYL